MIRVIRHLSETTKSLHENLAEVAGACGHANSAAVTYYVISAQTLKRCCTRMANDRRKYMEPRKRCYVLKHHN